MFFDNGIQFGYLFRSFFFSSLSHQNFKDLFQPSFDVSSLQVFAEGLGIWRSVLDNYFNTQKSNNLHESCLSPSWIQQRCRPYRPWSWRWISQHFPSTRPSWCASCRTPPWWIGNSLARTSFWKFSLTLQQEYNNWRWKLLSYDLRSILKKEFFIQQAQEIVM